MDMETELRGTCHFARVNDIIFPADCSDLFITCSVADIRVWNATLRQELLRIQVVRVISCMYEVLRIPELELVRKKKELWEQGLCSGLFLGGSWPSVYCSRLLTTGSHYHISII